MEDLLWLADEFVRAKVHNMAEQVYMYLYLYFTQATLLKGKFNHCWQMILC